MKQERAGLKADFSAAMWATIDRNLPQWCDREHFKGRLGQLLEVEIGRMDDPDFARGFAQACPIAGMEPSAYNQRLVEIEGLGRALVGIRFKGLDLDWPFVDWVASDFEIDGAGQWRRALQSIQREMAHFGPRWVRVWSWSGQRAPDDAGLERLGDQAVMAAPVGSLRKLPWPKGRGRLTLRKCDDLSGFERYAEAMERFRAGSPLGQEVSAISPQDWQECRDTGVVAQAFVDGQWAGLVAACWDTEGLWEGYCVQEELLDAPFRGCGLGPVMQRGLVELLPDPGAIIFGTIHATNLPSLATARRVGRVKVGEYEFLRMRV